jgi:hypothetical protein
VAWTSKTPGMATISASGLATSVATGTTTITTALNGVTSPAQTLTVACDSGINGDAKSAPDTKINDEFDRELGVPLNEGDGATVWWWRGTSFGPPQRPLTQRPERQRRGSACALDAERTRSCRVPIGSAGAARSRDVGIISCTSRRLSGNRWCSYTSGYDLHGVAVTSVPRR